MNATQGNLTAEQNALLKVIDEAYTAAFAALQAAQTPTEVAARTAKLDQITAERQAKLAQFQMAVRS